MSACLLDFMNKYHKAGEIVMMTKESCSNTLLSCDEYLLLRKSRINVVLASRNEVGEVGDEVGGVGEVGDEIGGVGEVGDEVKGVGEVRDEVGEARNEGEGGTAVVGAAKEQGTTANAGAFNTRLFSFAIL